MRGLKFGLGLVGALGCTAVACGPAKGNTDGGTPSGTDGGTTAGSDDAASTGGNPLACEPLVSADEQGAALQVVFRNAGDVPIFVGEPTDCILSPVVFTGPDGAQFEIDPTLCLESCDAFVDGSCSSIDCGACEGAEMIRLEPGAMWTHAWDGTIREAVTIPEDCAVPGLCDAACARRRLPDAGVHQVRASAHATCTTFDDVPCACPSGQDACIVYAGTFPTAAALATVDAEITFPSDTTVELVFP